jgi:hypothetical protein
MPIHISKSKKPAPPETPPGILALTSITPVNIRSSTLEPLLEFRKSRLRFGFSGWVV